MRNKPICSSFSSIHDDEFIDEQVDEANLDSSFYSWDDVADADPILSEEDSEENNENRAAALRAIEAANSRQLSDYVEKYITVESRPFRFISEFPGIGGVRSVHDRTYLRPLYDLAKQYPIGSRNQVWSCGRQVEKSVQCLSRVLMADGSLQRAVDIRVGDRVIAIDERSYRASIQTVTWKSSVYEKPSVRITTRQGHSAIFGHEHPILSSGNWVKSEDITLGDRVAVIASFEPETQTEDRDAEAWARLLGWLVSEGYVAKDITFTNSDPAALMDFQAALTAAIPEATWGVSAVRNASGIEHAWSVRVHRATSTVLQARISEASSFKKRVPSWVFSQPQKIRATFINRLWGGDGSCFQPTKSKYDITYTSVSLDLCRDLQALLWGFGVPTSLRKFTPSMYKQTDKVAWQIRVETQRGVRRFLTQIGAFGKPLSPPASISNNNRDTLPKLAIQDEIHRIYTETESRDRNLRKGISLHNSGLRVTLKHAPTRNKVAGYASSFSALGLDVSSLTRWESDALFWDEVIEVSGAGATKCVDFTVSEHHNFIVEGFVTHNSTSQSAKCITLGAIIPSFKTLYVAPRFGQVSVFSSQRFKPMAEDSRELVNEGLVQPSRTLWQVSAKEFTNRSFFNFRSCYITADGCRGITAHALLIDEVQDIISDNIPVLEECQSHWGWETGLRYRMYAGTPKTSNNTLSRRYRLSSQFEWIVRCHACSHDNFLDDKVVGKNSYICTRCGKPIFMRDGRWVPMNPAALSKCWGFRISQMMVPFKTHADIKEKMEDPNVSQLKLNNEVFGLSYDEGELILTEATMVKSCVAAHHNMTPTEVGRLASSEHIIVAGIDHGTGEGDSPSYTVLVLGTYDRSSGGLRVLSITKFIGRMAALTPQPGILNTMMRDANVTLAFSDWGFGAHQNARLVDEFGWTRGPSKRTLGEVQYVAQRQLAVYDPVAGRYKLDRNQSMIACIDSIKMGRIKFFNESAMRPFFTDFVTIYSEFNETYGTMKFDHVEPDDVFHGVNLCYHASSAIRGILVPNVWDMTKLDVDNIGY